MIHRFDRTENARLRCLHDSRSEAIHLIAVPYARGETNLNSLYLLDFWTQQTWCFESCTILSQR